jgi:hypothetical protein
MRSTWSPWELAKQLGRMGLSAPRSMYAFEHLHGPGLRAELDQRARALDRLGEPPRGAPRPADSEPVKGESSC